MPMTPAQKIEFDAKLAQQQQIGGKMTAQQQSEFDKKLAAQSAPRERTAGEYVRHTGQELARGGRSGGEFALDILSGPLSGLERHERGKKAYEEGEGFFGGAKGYLGEVFDFTSPTITGVMTKAAVNPGLRGGELPEIIPKGEDQLADIIGTGANILAESVVTAPMGVTGGLKKLTTAKEAVEAATPLAKSVAGMTVGGTAGEQMFGEMGELGGILAGSFAGDVQSLKQLAKMVVDNKATRAIGTALEGTMSLVQPWRRSGGGATTRDTRSALTQLIANRTGGKELPADFQSQLEGLVAELEPFMDEAGTMGQRLDDTGLQFAEREAVTGQGTKTRERQLELERINTGMRDDVLAAADEMTPSGVEISEAGIVPGQTAQAEIAAGRAGAETEAQALIDAQAGPLAQSRQMEADALAAQQTAATRQQADVAARGDVAPLAQSAEVSTQLKKSKAAAKDVVDDAYALIDGGSTVPVGNVHGVTAEGSAFMRSLGNENKQQAFRKAFPDTFKAVEDLVQTADVDDVGSILSVLSGEIHKINTGGGNKSMLRKVPGFRDALYKALETGPGGEATSLARKEATALFAEFDKKWGSGSKVGKALDAGEDTVGSTLVGGAGDKGVSVLKQTLDQGGPEVLKKAEDYMVSQFNDAVNKQSFRNRNARKLDLLPGARAQIDESLAATGAGDAASQALRQAEKDIGVGETALTKAETQAEKLRVQGAKDVEKLQSAEPAKWASVGQNEEDIIKAAHRSLKSGDKKNRVENITALVNSTAGDPEALKRLQKTFMRDLTNSVDKNGKLTKEGMDYFKANKDVLEESGMFTADQLQKLDDRLANSQKIFLHEDAGRLAKLDPQTSRVAEAVVSILGASAGSAIMSGNKLVGASIGRRTGMGWLKYLTSDKIDDIMYDLTFHPEKIADAVEKIKRRGGDVTPQELNDLLKRVASNLGHAGAVATAQKESEKEGM